MYIWANPINLRSVPLPILLRRPLSAPSLLCPGNAKACSCCAYSDETAWNTDLLRNLLRGSAIDSQVLRETPSFVI